MNSVSTARMRLHGGDRQLGAEQGAQGGSDARLAAAHQLGQMRVQHPARAHRTSPRAVRSSAHLYRAEFRKAERAGAGTAPVPTATQEKSTGLADGVKLFTWQKGILAQSDGAAVPPCMPRPVHCTAMAAA